MESFGYKAQTATATALTQNITGKSGSRIVIRAFGFTCANIATSLYFLQTLATTTSSSATASNLTTIALTSTAIGGTTTAESVGTVAANDYIAVLLDNGTYQFTTCASLSGSNMVINDALQDTVASGNTIYGLGAAGDSGQLEYLLTVSSQHTKDVDSGVFYGNAKSYPMVMYYLAASATATASLDYLTVAYTNKENVGM
jgi:hypothetical protein